MTIPVHMDFENNVLRLGDEVLTSDLDKRGGFIRRGEVIKLCPSAVRIRIRRTNLLHGDESEQDIMRSGGYIALVSHNPGREAELLNGPTIEL